LLPLRRVAPFVLVLASLAALALSPQRAVTVPLYAARTGLMCGSCHFDPNGGGPRNEFGFSYARNGHSLVADTTVTEVSSLTNRLGENLPVYFGLNQRFMLLANQQLRSTGLDRAGFFDMESAIHTVVQPHSRLTLVYSRDGFNTGSTTKDAWAMIGLSSNHYLKAGQFRVPFGLRLDDHTVATRNGFLDFQSQGRFLPYDPREPDRGVELGGEHGHVFGRVALTNGGDDPLGGTGTHAQAVTAKLGQGGDSGHRALSFYDDWTATPTGGNRATRWGLYTLWHGGPIAILAEGAAGTDAVKSGPAVVKTNLLAAFGELDWSPHAGHNLRVRADRLDLDRSTDRLTRARSSYVRWALEGEYEPVPFAQVRWAARLIQPLAEKDALGASLRDEKQLFAQLHVFY
jgi:hypothetical protein